MLYLQLYRTVLKNQNYRIACMSFLYYLQDRLGGERASPLRYHVRRGGRADLGKVADMGKGGTQEITSGCVEFFYLEFWKVMLNLWMKIKIYIKFYYSLLFQVCAGAIDWYPLYPLIHNIPSKLFVQCKTSKGSFMSFHRSPASSCDVRLFLLLKPNVGVLSRPLHRLSPWVTK